MRILFSVVLLLTFLALPALAQLAMFPAPAGVVGQKGSFTVGMNPKISGNGGYADVLAKALQSELKATGKQSSAAGGEIRLVLDEKSGMADEGYSLAISPETVLLEASSGSGLFYAKEALLQLVRFGGGTLKACKIDDRPRYGWRGFMLDESRHHVVAP